MSIDWKQDPRLKGMDAKKVKYLTDLAQQVEHTPKDKLMPLLLSLASANSEMNFNDQETELLVSILTANMSGPQKKQVETLRMLSKKLAGKSK